MSRDMPAREAKRGPSRTARPEHEREHEREREGARAAEERMKPCVCDEPGAETFRFDDPYWDDAFDSYYNPTLRTCCRY
jgi:hypothetical protein